MECTLSVLVENRFGVLAKISGLISARGFNIKSLTVAETEDPTASVMTIVVEVDDERDMEQVKKQLNKLIDVIKVVDLTHQPTVYRELVLVKVVAPAGKRSEIIELVEIFKAEIVDVSQKELTIELTGEPDKTEAFIKILKPYGIKEISRTGKIAIPMSMY